MDSATAGETRVSEKIVVISYSRAMSEISAIRAGDGSASGLIIKSVSTPSISAVHFTDTDHNYFNDTPNTLAGFSIMGDTNGDDICNTTFDDTHMYVWIYQYTFLIGPP